MKFNRKFIFIAILMLISMFCESAHAERRRVRRRARRSPSSSYERVSSSYFRKDWSLGAGVGVHTSSFGIGFGANAYYKIPIANLDRDFRVDAGLGAYYFPALSDSTISSVIDYKANAMEIFATGRFHYRIAPEFTLGGEAGLLYLRTSFSTSSGVLGPTDVSDSTIGFIVGGFGGYAITNDIVALMNLRVIVASGSALLLTAGAEYRF